MSVPAKVKTLVWHAQMPFSSKQNSRRKCQPISNIQRASPSPTPLPQQPLFALKWKNWFIRTAREYWMIYRGPGFLDVVWLDRIMPPTTIYKLDRRHTRRLRRRDNFLDVKEGPGVGKDPNHTTGSKIIQYSLHTAFQREGWGGWKPKQFISFQEVETRAKTGRQRKSPKLSLSCFFVYQLMK